jgi:hypothetical protein
MPVELGRHGIDTEKSQVRFRLDEEIIQYTGLRIALYRQRIDEIKDEDAERCQERLVDLPVFRPEQVKEEKDEKA